MSGGVWWERTCFRSEGSASRPPGRSPSGPLLGAPRVVPKYAAWQHLDPQLARRRLIVTEAGLEIETDHCSTLWVPGVPDGDDDARPPETLITVGQRRVPSFWHTHTRCPGEPDRARPRRPTDASARRSAPSADGEVAEHARAESRGPGERAATRHARSGAGADQAASDGLDTTATTATPAGGPGAPNGTNGTNVASAASTDSTAVIVTPLRRCGSAGCAPARRLYTVVRRATVASVGVTPGARERA